MHIVHKLNHRVDTRVHDNVKEKNMLEKLSLFVEKIRCIFKVSILRAKESVYLKFYLLSIVIFLILISCNNSQDTFFSYCEEIAKGIENDYTKSFFLTSLATIYAKKGEVDKVLETIDSIDNGIFKMSALYIISKQFAENGKFELAIELTNQISDDSQKLCALSEIAIEYAANEQFDKAISLAKSIDDLYYKSLSMSEIALKEFELRESSNSVELLDYALKMVDEIKDNKKREKLLKMIAVRYAIMKKYEEALKIADSLKLNVNKIGCLIGLSQVFLDNDEKNKAFKYLDEASEIIMIERNSLKGNADLFLADIAYKYIKANEYHTALKIAERIKSNPKKARTFVRISIGYKTDKKFDTAEKLLSKALAIASNEVDGFSKSIVYFTIAYEFINENHDEKGMKYLSAAFQVAESIDNVKERSKAFSMIAPGYVRLGNYVKSLQIAKREDVSNLHKSQIIANVADKHIETGERISKDENKILADIAKQFKK